MSTTAPEIVTVRSADAMDRETFVKHLNARHPESLGRGGPIDALRSDSVEDAYRAFHDRLHSLGVGLGHVHGD